MLLRQVRYRGVAFSLHPLYSLSHLVIQKKEKPFDALFKMNLSFTRVSSVNKLKEHTHELYEWSQNHHFNRMGEKQLYPLTSYWRLPLFSVRRSILFYPFPAPPIVAFKLMVKWSNVNERKITLLKVQWQRTRQRYFHGPILTSSCHFHHRMPSKLTSAL